LCITGNPLRFRFDGFGGFGGFKSEFSLSHYVATVVNEIAYNPVNLIEAALTNLGRNLRKRGLQGALLLETEITSRHFTSFQVCR